MNRKVILNILGKMILVEGVLMLLPTLVAVYYGEYEAAKAFCISILVVIAVGLPGAILHPDSMSMYAKEGFTIVGLLWILWSLLGALPFYLSREIPSYVDCFFETVSGFTTTGSSILQNVETLSRGMLFWRSFSHWVGGMGVLVFVMAILPLNDNNSIHLMRAEVPGPVVGKLVPKGKTTAKILYGIYVVMTLLEILLLVIGGMPLFDSILHSFGTAGTGGFGIKNSSIAYYNSAYIDYVIGIFMMLFGINFNIYYYILIRKFVRVKQNTELKTYLAIIAFATIGITISILPQYPSVSRAVRDSFFQVSSIITTTGYSTTDYNVWPSFAKTMLILLMICGSCAGSTGGGLKVLRVSILFKGIAREINRVIHPKSVGKVHINERPLYDETVRGVMVYLGLYALIVCASVLLVSFNNLDFETTFSSVIACMNNIGPGLGRHVGPAGNFAELSALSKLILSADMLLGRLEFIPLLIVCVPSIWRKRFI